MKRFILLFTLTLLTLFSIGINELYAIQWKKYVTSSFSFHYPAGWTVKAEESNVTITNTPKQEELLILALPFEANKSAMVHAKNMVSLLKKGMPDLKATGYREDEQDCVYFATTYTEENIPFRGEVLVVKDEDSATWFSYTAPTDGYNQKFGLELLQSLISTIASGNSSKPPTSEPSSTPQTTSTNSTYSNKPASDKMDKNARAFLFVLEFALGAPFNHSQDQLILNQLFSGWKNQSPESLKQYDAYPKLVNSILSLNQHDLETLRQELETTINEWLNESDQKDPVVRLIKRQLQDKSKVLINGNPSLTEMAATAYSEMTAFADLLSENKNASPSDISSSEVNKIRQLLQKSWNQFSTNEQNDILTTPGLWITFRTLLQFGNASEKEKIRNQLLKLSASASQTSNSSNSSGSKSSQKGSRPMSMVEHNVLMNIKQMTFNHYRWCHGFTNTIYGH